MLCPILGTVAHSRLIRIFSCCSRSCRLSQCARVRAPVNARTARSNNAILLATAASGLHAATTTTADLAPGS
ncbi:hypothetical protein AYI70_g3294 [Smittium culicis]|uniref:Uncharacterized protein n=1 Tax=Smittium culicis TaxID=133412 RepID=A0A1R1Y441_9FUNG|nr:hypothetical protein AYI70_g3294 [Smittium culicis]